MLGIKMAKYMHFYTKFDRGDKVKLVKSRKSNDANGIDEIGIIDIVHVESSKIQTIIYYTVRFSSKNINNSNSTAPYYFFIDVLEAGLVSGEI